MLGENGSAGAPPSRAAQRLCGLHPRSLAAASVSIYDARFASARAFREGETLYWHVGTAWLSAVFHSHGPRTHKDRSSSLLTLCGLAATVLWSIIISSTPWAIWMTK